MKTNTCTLIFYVLFLSGTAGGQERFQTPLPPPSPSPPVVVSDRSDAVVQEHQPGQEFLDAIPHRLELPESKLKTYIIDMETFEVVRSFDASLREYWRDLDIVLTESEERIYLVNGKESDTPPEPKPSAYVQDRDFVERTTVTLWNRLTGEKIREVTCDRAFSGGDESPLRIVRRKALLWNAKTRTTGVVDLVSGESLVTLPGYVQYVSADQAFLILQESGDISIRDGETLQPYCTVPGRTVRLSDDHSRFITWDDNRGDSGGDASVYELKTGRKINTFPAGKAAKLNQDATRLLVRHSSPSEIVLWDVDAGQKLWSVPFGGEVGSDYTFRFSEDGRIVTGSCNMRLPNQPKDFPRTYVWNAQTGKEIGVFEFFFMDHYLGQTNRMVGSINLGRPFQSKEVLCNAETGEQIAERFIGRFVASSADEQRFLTHRENTLYLWECETGKLLHKLEDEIFVPYKANITFDSNPALIKATTPVERLDSPFVSQVVLLDMESGEVVESFDVLPDGYRRFDDIVWKYDNNNAVFWNLEDGKAFFTIRLLPSEGNRWAPNIIGRIHFAPDGKELIYSTNMRPWRQRVMF